MVKKSTFVRKNSCTGLNTQTVVSCTSVLSNLSLDDMFWRYGTKIQAFHFGSIAKGLGNSSMSVNTVNRLWVGQPDK
jgi:hypothetical protein